MWTAHQFFFSNLGSPLITCTCAGAHRSRAADDKPWTTFNLKPQMVLPFSFPVLSAVDDKDDNVSNVTAVFSHLQKTVR